MRRLAVAAAMLTMQCRGVAVAQEPPQGLESYKKQPEIAKQIWSLTGPLRADLVAKQARLPRKYAVITRVIRGANSNKPDVTVRESERAIMPVGDGFAVIHDIAQDDEEGYRSEITTLSWFGFLRVHARRESMSTNPGGVIAKQIAIEWAQGIRTWTLDLSKIAPGYKWSFDYAVRDVVNTRLIRDGKESTPRNMELALNHQGECIAQPRVQASTFNPEFSGTAIPVTCTGSGADAKTTTTKYFYLEDYAYAYEADFFEGRVDLAGNVRREYRVAIVK